MSIVRPIIATAAVLGSLALAAPAAHAGGRPHHDPCKPAKITLTVQVDRYGTATKKWRDRAAGYDNDGLLRKGEDRGHAGKVAEIVTVTGNAKTSLGEWLTKINAATTKVPDLRSDRRWSSAAIKKAKQRTITVAWIISGDGKPDAWPVGTVAQRHLGSDRRP
jgi:hypothetical protein